MKGGASTPISGHPAVVSGNGHHESPVSKRHVAGSHRRMPVASHDSRLEEEAPEPDPDSTICIGELDVLCVGKGSMWKVLEHAVPPKARANLIKVEQVGDVSNAVAALAARSFDAVALDWTSAGRGRQTTCAELRAHDAELVIVGVADPDFTHYTVAFDSGLDDVLTAPFNVSELYARIQRAVRLRHERVTPQETQRLSSAPHEPPTSKRVGPLSIDDATATASVGGRILALTPLEFALLSRMVDKHPGIMTKEEAKTACGMPEHCGHRNAEWHVGNIRRKINRSDPLNTMIRTKWGKGWYLDAAWDSP